MLSADDRDLFYPPSQHGLKNESSYFGRKERTDKGADIREIQGIGYTAPSLQDTRSNIPQSPYPI